LAGQLVLLHRLIAPLPHLALPQLALPQLPLPHLARVQVADAA
jgi:hypothetical protein